jgi:hypothetical protein
MHAEHPPYEGNWTDFDKNISALSGHLDAHVRDEEDKRARVESGPNHPDLKAQELAHMDGALGTLRMKAAAAKKGYFFHDLRSMSGASPEHQKWVAMARKAGKLLNPGNFWPSLHAQNEEKASSLKVIRGGEGAFNLGSPAISTR